MDRNCFNLFLSWNIFISPWTVICNNQREKGAINLSGIHRKGSVGWSWEQLKGESDLILLQLKIVVNFLRGKGFKFCLTNSD